MKLGKPLLDKSETKCIKMHDEIYDEVNDALFNRKLFWWCNTQLTIKVSDNVISDELWI